MSETDPPTVATGSTIPDPVATAIPSSLQPDWENRRRVIFDSLSFCGAMGGLIIITGCALALLGVFFKSANDSLAVLNFLASALYTLAFVATSIIGSYVFGANFDWANARQHIVNLVSTTTGNNPPSTAPTMAIHQREMRKTP